jgi:hypothetical protein
MIQRKQTIFLLLAAIIFGAMFIVPFAVSNQPSVQFLSDGVFNILDHPVLLVLTLGGILMSLYTIFLYRKRKTQLRLGYIIIIIAILLPLSAFILFTRTSAEADTSVLVEDQFGLYLPVAAILFVALANYFIRKDERLVKSMDRLR